MVDIQSQILKNKQSLLLPLPLPLILFHFSSRCLCSSCLFLKCQEIKLSCEIGLIVKLKVLEYLDFFRFLLLRGNITSYNDLTPTIDFNSVGIYYFAIIYVLLVFSLPCCLFEINSFALYIALSYISVHFLLKLIKIYLKKLAYQYLIKREKRKRERKSIL